MDNDDSLYGKEKEITQIKCLIICKIIPGMPATNKLTAAARCTQAGDSAVKRVAETVKT
jgi:hypothetical protein